VSGLDAGVGPVDPAIEADGHDAEPGGGEHRLEQPPEGAELGAQVLGEVLAGVAERGVFGRILKPG
jgi:hypothetical protein